MTLKKTYNAVLNDRRVRELANISNDRVYNILHEHLHMKMLTLRCRICLVYQKRSREIAELHEEKTGKRFGSNIKVIDETSAYFEGLEKSYYTDGQVNVHVYVTLLKLANVPDDFQRKEYDLDNLSNWKATQYRFFLHYSSVGCLRKVLRKDVYEHFMLFIDSSNANNLVQLESGRIIRISDISYSFEGSVSLTGFGISKLTNLFEYPCDSKEIGVYQLGSESKTIQNFDINKIKRKCVLLTADKKQIAITLLHS
ncbi:hypothetical protein ALC60_13597 [Trachymyrmex zeteki]|uniref:Uncharacterized protein n=1 Tax=Mycetomoellerius zeteki TaxID=64791 RepID=A0A151WHQ0_9HYME|nr:hypothetical protein ALC60_13597 [Trachymyrmex zeteki]